MTDPQPFEWLIVFHAHSRRWVEMVCPGRFKHVSAVSYSAEARAWVALSWELGRMRVVVAPDAGFEAWLSGWMGEGAGVLRVPAPDFDTGPWRPRLGLFCVAMVAHLLGLRRGALWPDRLWRLLVANGAEIITDGRPLQAQGAGDGLGAVGDRSGGGCDRRQGAAAGAS